MADLNIKEKPELIQMIKAMQGHIQIKMMLVLRWIIKAITVLIQIKKTLGLTQLNMKLMLKNPRTILIIMNYFIYKFTSLNFYN